MRDLRNRRPYNLAAAAAAFALVAGIAAFGDIYSETFDTNDNYGGWSFGTGFEVIESTGGNPGAYLRESFLDSFAPQARCSRQLESRFIGDYRSGGVTSVGIDLILHETNEVFEGRYLSVMLIGDNGTTSDPNDDFAAYFVGPQSVPREGEGWRSYDFDIASQADALPSGWRWLPLGADSPTDPLWSDLMSDVAQLRFFFGDPSRAYIFQVWDVGMDNPRITTDGPGQHATLTDFGIARGTLISGGLDDLLESDDAWLVTRSFFGFSAAEAHVTEVRFTFDGSGLETPATLDITFEGRISQPGGTQRIRLRDWSGGGWEEVDTYSIGSSEVTRVTQGVDAAGHIRTSDGRIRVAVVQSVVASFSAAGFDSRFDLMAVEE